MKTVIKYSLFLLAMIVPMGELYAHADGVHAGGWMQNLLHIMQNYRSLDDYSCSGCYCQFTGTRYHQKTSLENYPREQVICKKSMNLVIDL